MAAIELLRPMVMAALRTRTAAAPPDLLPQTRLEQ
jgi:hypothetical protein